MTSMGRAIKKNLTVLSIFACGLTATFFASVTARADVVSDWNAIAVDAAVANGQNPFQQALTTAVVQLAVFDAVNSITHDYRPYLKTLPDHSGASPEAAAIEAAYDVLIVYCSKSASTLKLERDNSLGQIPDGPAKTDGIAAGDEAANAMIALRTGDGSTPPQFKVPGPAVPGEWQATGKGCPIMNGVAVGVAFQWQNVTPFGIRDVKHFLLPPPPALTSERYARTYNEVLTVGDVNSTQRPQDRADVATFFAATSPSQAFNQVAREVAQQQGRTLSENARALALMNMAISDSLVASFYNKYHYNFWRPVTAIHAGDTDGNPDTQADPNFQPFITTPCFPSYPSNHGSATSAAAEVLRRIYGEGGHSITLSNSAVPTITLQYDSLREITDDVSDARVYGGIHFRTDQIAGAHLGRAIGAAVYRHNLRRIHDDDDDDRCEKGK